MSETSTLIGHGGPKRLARRTNSGADTTATETHRPIAHQEIVRPCRDASIFVNIGVVLTSTRVAGWNEMFSILDL